VRERDGCDAPRPDERFYTDQNVRAWRNRYGIIDHRHGIILRLPLVDRPRPGAMLSGIAARRAFTVPNAGVVH